MTPDPTHELTALRHRERDLTAGLEAAQRRRSLTRSDLDDARNRAAGFEHSDRPEEKPVYEDAEARVTELQARLQADDADLATLERQLTEVRAAATAFFAGDDGHRNALACFRKAKLRAAQADAEAHLIAERQTAAAEDLARARQTMERAREAQIAALEPTAMAKARSALEQARRQADDAEILRGNLQRHGERLKAERDTARAALEDARKRVFSTQADHMAGRFRQQALGPALEAFAAARLAGSGWGFREFVADALDPRREFVPQAAETLQTLLRAQLETLTGETDRGT